MDAWRSWLYILTSLYPVRDMIGGMIRDRSIK